MLHPRMLPCNLKPPFVDPYGIAGEYRSGVAQLLFMLRRFARMADKYCVVGGPVGEATCSRDRVHHRHPIQAGILTGNLDLSQNEERPRRDNFRGDLWILQITTVTIGGDEFVLKL